MERLLGQRASFVLGACVFNLLMAAILFAETLGEAGGGRPS